MNDFSGYPGDAGGNAWTDEAWQRFVGLGTVDARCQAWLEVLCADLPGARTAAVLVENPGAGAYVPIAVWPNATPDLGRLAEVASSAARERRSTSRPAPELNDRYQLAYPLLREQRVEAIVAVELEGAAAWVAKAMRQIHWGGAWLSVTLGAHELASAVAARDRALSVLESCAVALRGGPPKQVFFEVANDLRLRFNCARVALGWVTQARVQLVALSETATFERQTPLARAYVGAMEEAYDRGQVMQANTDDPTPAAPAHRALLTLSGNRYVLSQPLMLGGETVAVLTLERQENPFGDADLAWLDAFAALAASALHQRQRAERSSLSRLASEAASVLKKLFGPRHLVWKTATALGVLLIAAMVLWPVTFRVTARAVIEGEEQRVITAPFEGYIAENKPANDKSSPDKSDKVFPGKEVKAGEVLARLDGRELEKELKRWTSEIDQIESRLRQTWGSSELAGKPVLLAQLEQATAQRDLVADKIARLALTAPFAGIVVSGDLRQQVGAPVETGKKLFEIARLNSYRIILQVDERDIAYLSKEQMGRLMMTGIAGEPIDFTVSGVTPVAVAQEGRNFFRVEATIQKGLERLRPGMEGVAKVEIGPRSLWWVMTRSFSDWLRLELWRWLP